MRKPPNDDISISAVLTLSTPSGMHCESLTVPAHHSHIAGAVIRFAAQHGISAGMVSVGVLYSDESAQAVAA